MMTTTSGKNRTSRWMVAAAAAASVAAVLGLYLGMGSSQAEADVVAQPPALAAAAGVQPEFERARVTEFVPGQLTLAIDLRWTCAPDRLGVTRTSGWLAFSHADADDEVLRVHCELGSPVEPGGSTNQRLELDWDEWNDAHQWLRRAESGEVHVSFAAESATGITRAVPPEAPAPMASASPGRVRTSR